MIFQKYQALTQLKFAYVPGTINYCAPYSIRHSQRLSHRYPSKLKFINESKPAIYRTQVNNSSKQKYTLRSQPYL